MLTVPIWFNKRQPNFEVWTHNACRMLPRDDSSKSVNLVPKNSFLKSVFIWAIVVLTWEYLANDFVDQVSLSYLHEVSAWYGSELGTFRSGGMWNSNDIFWKNIFCSSIHDHVFVHVFQVIFHLVSLGQGKSMSWKKDLGGIFNICNPRLSVVG